MDKENQGKEELEEGTSSYIAPRSGATLCTTRSTRGSSSSVRKYNPVSSSGTTGTDGTSSSTNTTGVLGKRLMSEKGDNGSTSTVLDNLALLGDVDPVHTRRVLEEESQQRKKQQLWKAVIAVLAVACGIAAIATSTYFLAAFIASTKNGNSNSNINDGSSSSSTTMSYSEANTPTTTFENVLNQPDTTNSSSKSYADAYNVIVSSGLTSEDLLQVGSSSPQRMALRWMILGDQAKLDPATHPSTFLDRYALSTFFFATRGPQWRLNSNWLQNPNICTWVGIQCDTDVSTMDTNHYNNNYNYYISSLALPQNNLYGTIPTEVFLPLQRAVVLNLFGNQLQGAIPDEIGSLQDLTTLALLNNTLVGTIPTTIGTMQNLVNLLLSGNELDGNIPTQLGSLTSLQQLHLYNNKLYGSLPTQLSQLTRLRRLWLSQNHLAGNLPPNIFQSMPNLQAIYLDQNFFTGSLQQSGLFSSSNSSSSQGTRGGNSVAFVTGKPLQDIRLYKNIFTGPIPTEIGLLNKLELLYLDQNSFTGTIPDTLQNLINLRELSLFMNHLQGTLPPIFWKKLTSIQVIDVGDNQLKGTISDEPIDLEQLRKVRLYKNQFSGTLPDLSACTNLDDLELQKNNFRGTIPSWLGNFYKLSSLLISSNRLLGSIPSSLANLDKLQYLRLQDNDNLVDGSALEDICNKLDSSHPSIIVDCQIQCTCCDTCLASSIATATTSTTTISTTRFNQGN